MGAIESKAAGSAAVFGELGEGRVLGSYLDRVKGNKPTLLVVSEAHVTSYNPRTSDRRVRVPFEGERITCSAARAGTMLGNILVLGTSGGNVLVLDTEELTTVKTVPTAARGGSEGAAAGSGTGIVTCVGVYGSEVFLAGHADGSAGVYVLMGGGARPLASFAPPPTAPLPQGADPRVVSMVVFGAITKPVVAVGHACGAVHHYAMEDGTWLAQRTLKASLVEGGGLASLLPLRAAKALVGVPAASSTLQVWDLVSGKALLLESGGAEGASAITSATFDEGRALLVTGQADGAVMLRTVARDEGGALSFTLLRVAAPSARAGGVAAITSVSYDGRGDLVIAGDGQGVARMLPRASGLPPPSGAALAGAIATVDGAAAGGGGGGEVYRLPFTGGWATIHTLGGAVTPEFTAAGAVGLVQGVGFGAPLGSVRPAGSLAGEWAQVSDSPAGVDCVGAESLPPAAVTAKGAVVNGYASHAAWHVVSAGAGVVKGEGGAPPPAEDADSCALVLECVLPTPSPIAKITKRVSARTTGHGGLVITTTITPSAGASVPIGVPITFRLPQGDPGTAALQVGGFEFGVTAPYGGGGAGPTLAPAATFSSLSAVPVAATGAGTGLGGGTTPADMTLLPPTAAGMSGTVGGTLQLCGVEGRATLTSTVHGAAVTAVWDALSLPSALLHLAPGRLTLTPCVSAMDLGTAVSGGANPLADRGVDTALALSAGEEVEVSVTLTAAAAGEA